MSEPSESRYVTAPVITYRLTGQALPVYFHKKRPHHFKIIDLERNARIDLVATACLDGLSGQRWIIETLNSVIKRKFGDTISSRSTCLQLRKPIIKGLIHNIH